MIGKSGGIVKGVFGVLYSALDSEGMLIGGITASLLGLTKCRPLVLRNLSNILGFDGGMMFQVGDSNRNML